MQSVNIHSGRFRILFVLAIFILPLASVIYILLVPHQGGKAAIPVYMILYSLSFSGVLFFFFQRNNLSNSVDFFGKIFPLSSIIIFIGILTRSVLLVTNPATSDDHYRYLWEGKILINGYNPYEFSPQDSALAHLYSTTLPEKVTFKKYTSIYPPGAQFVFMMGYLISGESVMGLKIIFLICEIVLLLVLLHLLRMKNLPEHYLAFYALLPLPVMEYFINVHIDVAALPFFLLFILYSEKQKTVSAAILFGITFLLKSYAIFALPALLRKFSVKNLLIFGVVSGTMIILAYLPFVNEKRPITDMLVTYLQRWEFNGGLYSLLKLIFGSPLTARYVCLAVLGLGTLYVLYKNFGLIPNIVLIYSLVAMTSTTLYPWYLGWLAVLFPLQPMLSAGSLFFTVNFSNFTPLGEVWKEYVWVLLVQYIPFYILLFLDLKRFQKMKTTASSQL